MQLSTIVELELPDTSAIGSGTGDMLELMRTRQQLQDQYRSGTNQNLPLNFEQRLELALRDAKEARAIAIRTYQIVAELQQQVQLLQSHLPNPTADDSGQSIFDD